MMEHHKRLIPFRKTDQWGLVKPNGEFPLPIIYDLPVVMGQAIHEISDGMIVIKKGPLLGYADMNGKEVIPLQYTSARRFVNDITFVNTLEASSGYITKDGTEYFEE